MGLGLANGCERPDSRGMLIRPFITMICLALFSAPTARAEVLVFAAASLKEPVDAMAAEFPDVVVSYAGSGTLARQVSQGAPADVVLLANADWMNYLRDGDHVQPHTVSDFASNGLVLIGPATSNDVSLTADGISHALGGGRIAVGLTNAVPAGIYAKEALIHLGLWDQFDGQLAEVDNVRAALALVARGQAPLGIVYATDARISDAVRVVANFPQESHTPIRYTGALTPDADENAATFWAFVTGPEGRAIMAEAGFLPPVSR